MKRKNWCMDFKFLHQNDFIFNFISVTFLKHPSVCLPWKGFNLAKRRLLAPLYQICFLC